MKKVDLGWRPKTSARSLAKSCALVLSVLLVLSGAALAASGGLLNPSFEQGSGSDLTNWTVKAYDESSGVRQQVYGPGQNPVPCVQGDPYGICVINGSDTFSYRDEFSGPDKQETVPPLDGSKMVRLGGPFKGSWIDQAEHGLAIEQSFTVDASNPVVNLNYNFFTFDYSGFDEVYLKVRLTSPGEPTITERIQGGFGSGIDLKTTGWRNSDMDLSDYIGDQVNLEVELHGTSDTLYGSWAYLDAGTAPDSVISTSGTSGNAPDTPAGDPVTVHKYVDQGSGLVYFTAPASQAAQFPGGCMPFEIDVPLNPGSGQISDVSLTLNGASTAATEVSPNSNIWRVQIPCAESGNLWISYTLTEGDTSQQFIVPLGGITLVDPQGVVYDKDEFDAAKAGGKTDEQARSIAAIAGATVTLQRQVDGEYVNVLSGDPGISPNINPETTGSDGIYQWDVSEGNYRVVVTKDGYEQVASHPVDIPPPVLDLHVALTKIDTTPPDTTIDSGPSGTIAGTQASFTFSGKPAGDTAKIQCKIDSGAFADCTSPKTFSALADGSHTVSFRAQDAAGNQDKSPASRTFTVDTTPPDTTIDSGPSGTIAGTQASFTFSGKPAGDTAKIQCKIDSGAFADCTSPKTFSALADGSHTVSFRAQDAAGNQDKSPASRTFTVDTGPSAACVAAEADLTAAKSKLTAASKKLKGAKKGLKKAKGALKKAKKSGKSSKVKKAKKKVKKTGSKVKKAKSTQKKAKVKVNSTESAVAGACA